MIKEEKIEDNLKANSVYYAKNIPHAKDKRLVLSTLIDNLEYINKPKVNNLRYDIDGLNFIIKSNNKEDKAAFGNLLDDNYNYENEKHNSYILNKNFKLVKILDENYNYIDLSTVDEQAIIDEIYELVKPVIDSQTEPEENLQEEFNKRYKDRFN